jgi:hypothetical protein
MKRMNLSIVAHSERANLDFVVITPVQPDGFGVDSGLQNPVS